MVLKKWKKHAYLNLHHEYLNLHYEYLTHYADKIIFPVYAHIYLIMILSSYLLLTNNKDFFFIFEEYLSHQNL